MRKSTFVGYILLLSAMITLSVASIQAVMADPGHGTNGQCRQLQKTFPPEIQDFQGCHDTFTGKDHNNPPPLP